MFPLIILCGNKNPLNISCLPFWRHFLQLISLSLDPVQVNNLMVENVGNNPSTSVTQTGPLWVQFRQQERRWSFSQVHETDLPSPVSPQAEILSAKEAGSGPLHFQGVPLNGDQLAKEEVHGWAASEGWAVSAMS